MDAFTSALKKQIENAKSVPECETIRQHLEALVKCTNTKKNSLEEENDSKGLNFQGHCATPCSFCDNTMDPQNQDFCGTCEGCNKIACKECYGKCKGCEKLLCVHSENCGMKYCESCGEYLCSDCAIECWKCNGSTCEGCVTLVGPPQWQCCEECRDEWVEDGWHEY